MKRILILILIVLFLGSCSQLSVYDEYIDKWDLDLPQPSGVSFGKLLGNLPKEYDNFDLIFSYDEAVKLLDQEACKELSDEERYDMIGSMYELYKFKERKTIEEKRRLLEEYLEIDLGPGARIYKQVSQREHIFILPRVNPLEIYMLRTLD